MLHSRILDDVTPTDEHREDITSSAGTSRGVTEDIRRTGNPLSHPPPNDDFAARSFSNATHMVFPYNQLTDDDSMRSIHYTEDFRKEYEDSFCESSDDCADDDDDEDEDNENSFDEFDEDMSDDDLISLCPKYLIFSTGSKTYTPHQIGFKRVRNISFPKKLEPGPSLKERIAAKERAKIQMVN